MKWNQTRRWGAVLSTTLAGLMGSSLALAADHLDGPAVQKDAATDINDVYTWMDGNNVVMAMTVHPAATTASKFSDAAQYVLHAGSSDSLLANPAGADINNVICTFDAAQKIQCWLGTKDYVTGDASAAAGITSTSGKLKVFAGLRADPFFFNLQGFRDTVSTVKAAAGGLTFDAFGCPTVDATTSGALVGLLGSSTSGATEDFFKDLNVLSIVVSIDKAELTTSAKPLLAVWASTNGAP
jgi:hypothetical protein